MIIKRSKASEPTIKIDPIAEELQRLAELGRLSASLLHEISNPLSAALIHLEQIKDHDSYSFKETRRSLKRLERYVKAARLQLRSQSAATSFRLPKQIEEVKRLVTPLAHEAGVSLHTSKVPNLKLKGDRIKFQQILTNLIINAIEAYGKDQLNGLYRGVKVKLDFDGQYLNMEVIDWGEGIKPSQIPKLFEPFYTTKNEHGLGIGLVIVEQYVTDSFHGSINVISSPRFGTRFKVKIPAIFQSRN